MNVKWRLIKYLSSYALIHSFAKRISSSRSIDFSRLFKKMILMICKALKKIEILNNVTKKIAAGRIKSKMEI